MAGFLSKSGATPSEAGSWQLSGLLDKLGELAVQGLRVPLRFAAQAVLYLLAACAVGLLAGNTGWRKCVDTVAVLGFGSLSLASMMALVEKVGATAAESQTYLAAFVPVYSGVALLGGQTAGAAAYSGMFFAMSGLLSTAIQRLLLPVMQIYFCFAVCAAIWGGSGLGQAADLFSRCLTWLLKGCGAVFSLVLGLQSMLAGISDSAALKVGKNLLSGAVPVIGGVAAAALSGAAASLRLLKGSLALAVVLSLGGAFAPVFLHCTLYVLAFYGAGIAAEATGQKQCGQICKLYAEGSRLCGSILTLYFFMVFLSTTLLLLTGNGG